VHDPWINDQYQTRQLSYWKVKLRNR